MGKRNGGMTDFSFWPLLEMGWDQEDVFAISIVRTSLIDYQVDQYKKY